MGKAFSLTLRSGSCPCSGTVLLLGETEGICLIFRNPAGLPRSSGLLPLSNWVGVGGLRVCPEDSFRPAFILSCQASIGRNSADEQKKGYEKS
jgi:hypothetical protein